MQTICISNPALLRCAIRTDTKEFELVGDLAVAEFPQDFFLAFDGAKVHRLHPVANRAHDVMVMVAVERRHLIANGVVAKRSEIACREDTGLDELRQTSIDRDQVDARTGSGFFDTVSQLFRGEGPAEANSRLQQRLALPGDFQTVVFKPFQPQLKNLLGLVAVIMFTALHFTTSGL